MADNATGRRVRLSQRREALRGRVDSLSERAQDERGRRGWVDAIFEVADRDVEIGGGIIAGALAYRLVLWLLPFGLVFVGGLGVGILQFSAAYLLGPYALEKQGTYGALGVAAAVLLSLWTLGRLLVGGAEINATLWERKQRGTR